MGCFTGFLAEGGIQGFSLEEEGCVRLWLRLLARIVFSRHRTEERYILGRVRWVGLGSAGWAGLAWPYCLAVVYRGSVTI